MVVKDKYIKKIQFGEYNQFPSVVNLLSNSVLFCTSWTKGFYRASPCFHVTDKGWINSLCHLPRKASLIKQAICDLLAMKCGINSHIGAVYPTLLYQKMRYIVVLFLNNLFVATKRCTQIHCSTEDRRSSVSCTSSLRHWTTSVCEVLFQI